MVETTSEYPAMSQPERKEVQIFNAALANSSTLPNHAAATCLPPGYLS